MTRGSIREYIEAVLGRIEYFSGSSPALISASAESKNMDWALGLGQIKVA